MGAPSQLDGRTAAPWGATVAVQVLQPPTIVGWPGLTLPAQLRVGLVPSVVFPPTCIGVIDVDLHGRHATSPRAHRRSRPRLSGLPRSRRQKRTRGSPPVGSLDQVVCREIRRLARYSWSGAS